MHDDANLDGAELKAILEGHSKSFEILFRKYYQELCGYCMGILGDSEKAEDVVQDAFVYLWENRRKINIKVSLKSYLYQSTRNGALKVLRSQALEQRHAPHLTEFIEYLEQSEFSEDELAGLDRVERAIEELPSQCKTVFLMSLVDGKSYQQIGDELGISLNTVKTHKARARQQLKTKLQDLFVITFILGL